MNKIQNIDKLQHFVAGMGISLTFLVPHPGTVCQCVGGGW